ncbi:MAG: TIGR03016 family PEP-CTERM system-associated outer membrane protein [Rhodoferax sp.]|nr:TIGR03016 family PEP-CTERM system-associated outer membrane protein [Rhodoferax sp.]
MSSPLSLLAARIRAARVPVAGVLFMASAGTVCAQDSTADAGARRSVSVVPRVSVTETLTDNVRLSSTGRQAEQTTEISPGIRITSDSRRLKAYFDYSLNEVLYAQNSSPSQLQNALSAFGTLEAVDNWAYVDFSGSISQQTISAFGTQSFGNTSINANRTEVSSYRISPYLKGRLGNVANYEARYSRAVTGSEAAIASGVTTVDGLVKISGDTSFRRLGWSTDVSRQSVDYSAGRPTEVDRLNVGLSYLVSPQLSLFANAGREANNYTSLDKQNYATSGFGANWSPSERTRLSAARYRRSFGDAHSFSFDHRTARTAWKFSDTKDVSTTPGLSDFASLDVIADVLNREYERVGVVAPPQLINFLLSIPGFTNGFLTSAVSLQRRQDLSFSLLGVRDTITFLASRSESSRLDTVSSNLLDDFTTSSLVRQRGLSVNYAHRLAPDYSLGVLVSQQNTSGDLTQQDTKLRLLNVNVTGKVGKQATASLGLRHVISSGNTAPYVENAVIGSLNVQF